MQKTFEGNNNHKVIKSFFQDSITLNKIYNQKPEELKKFDREYNFYKYCKENKITCVPNLVGIKKNILILEYINGTHLENVNTQNLYLFSNFLKQLNSKNNRGMMDLPIAGEAILMSRDLILNIKKRIEQVGLNGKYHPRNFKIFALEILSEGEQTNHEIGKIIANPSDFGVHNSLICEDHLFFFDFEYSGKDSLLKCIMDFVLHPANKIDISEINNVTKDFSEAVGIIDFNISESTKRCFYLWWILRLLNSISKPTLKYKVENNLIEEKDLELFINERLKIINYFYNNINGSNIKK